ncbi:TonB-dependent receptor [Flavihumibacter petaseus]|uniref:Putative TonB-dependent receptor n=1 Tax=Flavihumibacter petaseus NBRC 106054 TaxID=1220578 RepID=A0A0E9N0B2_9BACT|nr:TonB-dependent receptor [Flavihumibacter petaseus]GAO43432.1 putative TonB-dependent receptor [Flavihumibacter petaseus NBRC 106054]
MMFKYWKNLIGIFGILIPFLLSAQVTQTLRGQVTDQLLQTPVAGATVSLPALNRKTVTDQQGYFRFDQVPIGIQQLNITHTGYQEIWMDNLNLISGKEMVLSVPMQLSIKSEAEVVVKAKALRTKPLNELSVVSARAFSVEETQRYAAAVNDPLRMATSFAGVVGSDDGGNNIVIRGNAPSGLLWRMEGVDIPNPNHFASANSSGGGISILSAQLLSTSDFVTGAFAAEYGNALGGAFDLHLRKGNNEKREYTAQIGMLGLNLAAEGPFSKHYKGSYLVNYRYSTLQLLGKLGLDIGTGSTDFQDLSFNINLPAGKAGTFTLFGFGGQSAQNFDTETDPVKWETEADRYGGKYEGKTGVAGMTYSLPIGKKIQWKTRIAYSLQENQYDERYAERPDSILNTYKESYDTRKMIANTAIQYQLSNKHAFSGGLTFTGIRFNYLQHSRENPGDPVLERINTTGNTGTVQAFAQWQYRMSEKWMVTGGLHFLQLMLNNTNAIEPRVAIRYDADRKNSFAFGYGSHSQIQGMGVYFAETPDGSTHSLPNKNLDLTRAQHFVLSYNRLLGKGLKLRAEAYYQMLADVPISIYDTSTFSTLNIMEDFVTDPLVNNGKGRNYGLEISFEKQLRNHFYLLFSNSFYKSLYTAADGVERNTRFNGGLASTLTAGKEFVHHTNKRSFGVNGKLVYLGGYRDTPINFEASEQLGYTKYYENLAFSQQMPAYFRMDIRLSMKWNRPRHTSTLSLDVQNLTNRANIYGRRYDPLKGEIINEHMTGIIPVLNYAIQF